MQKKRSPVNMLDPIQKSFGYGQLWPFWPACSQNWAGLYILDPTSHLQFSSILPKKAWTVLCKSNLDRIWMAWAGFFPSSSGPEASKCARITGPLTVSNFWTQLRSLIIIIIIIIITIIIIKDIFIAHDP